MNSVTANGTSATLLISLIVSLIIFLLLARLIDIPGFFQRIFHLNAGWKMFLFIFAFGAITMFLVLVVCNALQLDETSAEIVMGAVIGFNCADIFWMVKNRDWKIKRPENGTKKKKRKLPLDNRQKRSKG